jgi:hypothetical protein
MELDKIYALATRVKRRFHCCQQMAEYMASLLTLAHVASGENFELLADIQAIYSLQVGG